VFPISIVVPLRLPVRGKAPTRNAVLDRGIRTEPYRKAGLANHRARPRTCALAHVLLHRHVRRRFEIEPPLSKHLTHSVTFGRFGLELDVDEGGRALSLPLSAADGR
jgi:hypothetical protein